MTSTKAISLISMQLDKLNTIDKDSYQAWKTQSASYIKDIFCEDSEEYKFVKQYQFISSYNDNSYDYQIIQNTPSIRTHLENCIESLEHRGLIKPKIFTEKENWTKRFPLIFEIVKSIIILTLGFMIRYITEPKVVKKINEENNPAINKKDSL